MRRNKFKPPSAMKAVVFGMLKGQLNNIVLTLFLLGTAFSLITMSHQQRQLFAELESLEQERDKLDIEWRKFRLEQRVMAEHSRLEQIAKEKLGMKNLDLKSERIVRQVKDGE
jgi:cell division protein FtsL